MSKVRLVLLSLLAVGLVSAVASASASAVMPAYTHEDGSLITGSLNVLSTHSGNAVLKGTLAGIKVEIVCEEEHGTGTIENSATTGMGLGLASNHYLKCTMPKPEAGNCLVHNHLVEVNTHALLELLPAGGYQVLFTPDNSTNFALITVESCSNAQINGTYPVEGTAVAMVNNSNLTLEFTTSSGSKLTFGSNPATYTDEVKVEMAGGGAGAGIMVEDGS